MIFWENLIFVIVAVIAPIVPASLLYRALRDHNSPLSTSGPSPRDDAPPRGAAQASPDDSHPPRSSAPADGATDELKGPFHGFALRLTGASAVYFVIFLTVIGFWKLAASKSEVWSVTGWTRAESDAPSVDVDKVFVTAVPQVNLHPDGTFEIHVTRQDNGHGGMDLPDLVIDRPGEKDYPFKPAYVHLRPMANFPTNRTKKHWFAREIEVEDQILLQQKPTVQAAGYHPTAPAPLPIKDPPPPPPSSRSAASAETLSANPAADTPHPP